ncbi:GcrA family cell cycle regulator [Bradyrhizobium sp. 191]|uniref:GcrA family cell cycle regulator n=1 Tax=Bradyrhizobium sp. 191 TaxID=2782659 RepID=UPI001FFEA6EF|nr:GcrA family cell cycle regulator [Bradyrhizobium sp. 191]UPJ65269.1 GcrA cell cycle regulator [Bradyrhizobium sp. 191]
MIGGATTTRADIAGGDLDQARRENGWTATRTRVAIALFNSGLSAAEVAREIGGISRNGVIGKVHRSGLSEANRKASRAAGEARASRRKRIADASSRRSIVRPKPSPEEAPPPSIADQKIPAEQRRTLAQLDSACCHWPVGDPQTPDFFFCGAPKANDEGIPYCPSHLVRSRQRDVRPSKPVGAAFLNAPPNAPWRAR